MFTTGQPTEGAVNYGAASAVCGSLVTGDTMNVAVNQLNMALPANQACAAPIGPKWISAITNWLCFVIDRAGNGFEPGNVCQNPLLLWESLQALVFEWINTSFVDCVGQPIVRGDALVRCSELPDASASFVDCTGTPIAPGTALVTCAEYSSATGSSFNPFTSFEVGAVVILPGTFHPAGWFPLPAFLSVASFGVIGPSRYMRIADSQGGVYTGYDWRWNTAGQNVPGTWELMTVTETSLGSLPSGPNPEVLGTMLGTWIRTT